MTSNVGWHNVFVFFLQMNNSKSQIILFNYPHQKICVIESTLGSLSMSIKPTARNLDIMIDLDLPFEPHIYKVVQPCFMRFRTISKIKAILSHSDLEKLTRSSFLDWVTATPSCLASTKRLSPNSNLSFIYLSFLPLLCFLWFFFFNHFYTYLL